MENRRMKTLTAATLMAAAALSAAMAEQSSTPPGYEWMDEVKFAYGPFQVGATGFSGTFVAEKPYPALVVSGIFARTPADGVLQVGDVIKLINGVGMTGERPRIALGKVLTKAEATDGILNCAIVRKGKQMNAKVTIPVLGAYSATSILGT